jgi:PilZ domain
LADETNISYGDRRRARRYPVALPLRYRTASGSQGKGESVNISSKGLLFRCESQLHVGDVIEAELDWPDLGHDHRPVVLKVYGMVVRRDAGGTAMSISKYEFPRRERP